MAASGKYIPPALRRQSIINQQPEPASYSYSLADIDAYYVDRALSNSEEPVAIPRRTHCTLNTSNDGKDTIGYITLFHQSNPFWETRKEIFCKSNLDLLPGDETTTRPKSYPVFVEERKYHKPNANFIFAGYYEIQSIRYLEPESKELIDYLEEKFKEKTRVRDAWKESLSRRWAVITMRQDKCRGKEVPHITPIASNRGVNDMLSELRAHGEA